MPVLFQFAEGDGPIELYDIWKRPIRETLSLVESWMEKTIIGFNLAFDHFMVAKLYTTFRLADPRLDPRRTYRRNRHAGTTGTGGAVLETDKFA